MPERFACADCRTMVAGYEQTPPPSWLVSAEDPEQVLCLECQEARVRWSLGRPSERDRPC